MSSPWLKFYPTDWQSDPALRVCSLAARGLWAEMLCVKHKANPYGSLVINGKAVTSKQLAALVSASQRDVDACLKELEDSGVFSRDADGTIYSRRMRRDHDKAEKDRENGKNGGNPSIVGPRRKTPREVNQKPPDKFQKGLTPPLTSPPAGEVNTQSQKPESDSDSESHQHPPEFEATRARSLISAEAHTIADAIGQAAGFSKENWPPGWCGLALQVQKFISEGCPGDLVRDTATSVLKRKRDGPPENFSYFDRPIATAFAQFKRPLPEVSAPDGALNGQRKKNRHRRRKRPACRHRCPNCRG